MSAHHCCPCLSLALLLILCVIGGISDSGRVEKHLCPLHSHQSGCLRIPLIPAHQHSQSPRTRVNRVETEVAGREVELLIVGRIVRNMHLSVFAGDGSVLLYYHGGIVVQPCGAPFEERRDNDDTVLFGQ